MAEQAPKPRWGAKPKAVDPERTVPDEKASPGPEASAQGEALGTDLFRRFRGAFPAGYKEEFDARNAVGDITMMARLDAKEPLSLSLYRPPEAAP